MNRRSAQPRCTSPLPCERRSGADVHKTLKSGQSTSFSELFRTPGDISLGTGHVRLTAGESAGPARGTSSRRPHGTAQVQPRKGALESARTARIPPVECGRNRESVAPQTWQGQAHRASRMRNTLSTSHGPGLQLEDATRPIGPEQRPQHGRHAVARCCRTARNVQRHTLIAACNAQPESAQQAPE